MSHRLLVLLLCACANPAAHRAAAKTSPRNVDAAISAQIPAGSLLAPDDPLAACDLPATPPCPAEPAPAEHHHEAM